MPQYGYCGIGFGLTMYNVDMIQITAENTIDVYDKWSVDRFLPYDDTHFNGTNDVVNEGITINNGILYGKARRALVTEDVYDSPLEQNKETEFC